MRMLIFLCLLTGLLMGCRQQMAKQPAYRPLQPSSFFEDGRASRPLVEGTVARGQVKADTHFHTGKHSGTTTDPGQVAALVGGLGAGTPLTVAAGSVPWSPYVDTFPFPVTGDTLKAGRAHYNVFCAVCHGRSGDGKGMIPQRGFTEPPSFITDEARGFKLRGVSLQLRDAPVGYYFDVITNGYGAMPDYAGQFSTKDRWEIIAYIRVLQYSQGAWSDRDRSGGGKR